jgi:tetratricopeptide (TPR) repeat protein
MNQTILDFHIRRLDSDSFGVTVFERGQSQPLATSSFDYRLSNLTEYEIDRLDFDRKNPQARIERLRAFGLNLYRRVFSESIEEVWRQRRERDDFLTLCVRIDESARGLEALPWETLHAGEEFLAAGVKTSISRLPLDIQPQEALAPVSPPIRMLAFAASPLDLPDGSRLNIEREQEILLEAINTPAGEGWLQVDFEDEAKLEILESALDTNYHILHFTGHGISPYNGGGLLLEDADGRMRPVGVNEFIQSLDKGREALRLAVISGCQTARTLHTGGFRDLARALARRGVPAVLAMQFSISDHGGLKLAETLYPKLIDGRPIEVALSAARHAMLMIDDPLIQADALAVMLIASTGQPLQLAGPPTAGPIVDAGPIALDLDTSVYLGTLPQLGFRFYGRRREYRRLRDGLLQRGHRVAIIHGIGGIGKTSLVSHLASRLQKRFRGVYAFDCSVSQLAPERIMLELHRYFELQSVKALERFVHQRMEPEMSAQILAQLLTQWPLLVIFDNFESQLDDHAEGAFRIADQNLRRFLAALVKATATGSRFLFTSRYLFDLDDRLADVFSLPLGDLSRPETIYLMLRSPSLSKTFFLDKWKAFDYFGGHPLAITLLDKRCKMQPLYEVLQDVKAIHASLREYLAIELNYNRLSERGRELLDRLAAFRRPVPRQAVEWVIGEKTPYGREILQKIDRNTLPDVIKNMSDEELVEMANRSFPEQRLAINVDQPISELIEWGLLTPIHEGNELRSLSVHSLVRDFCRGRQQGENWRARLHDAAAFYTNLIRMMPREEKTPTTVWNNEMEAFELLMEADDFGTAANLLAGIDSLLSLWGFNRHLESLYWRLLSKVRGRDEAIISHNLARTLQALGAYDEALSHYQQSLKIAEEIGDKDGVATVLHNLGGLHREQGSYDEALSHFQHSLKIYEELRDISGVAKLLAEIGTLHQFKGAYDEALNYYQRSLKIAEEIGDIVGAARSLHNVGTLHQLRGAYDEALSHYQRALKIKEEIGDNAGVASSLYQIGTLHKLRGAYDEALNYYQRSLKIAEEIGVIAGVARSLYGIGTLHEARGAYDTALNHYQRSLKIFEELGDIANVASSLRQIGVLHQTRGAYDEALNHYQRSLKIAEEIGDIAGVSSSLHQIGVLHQFRGSYDEALSHYQRSLKIAEEIGDIDGTAGSLHNIGRLHQARGAYDTALSHYQRSLKIFEELGDIANVASSLLQIGMLHWDRGDYDEALSHYQRSLKINEELGDIAGVAKSLHEIGMLHQAQGAYEEALNHYQRSLKINEEIGDIINVAVSQVQIGLLMMEREQYDQAFVMLVNALVIFVKLQSPYKGMAIGELKELRNRWGGENFDRAWQRMAGKPVPEWMKENSGK